MMLRVESSMMSPAIPCASTALLTRYAVRMSMGMMMHAVSTERATLNWSLFSDGIYLVGLVIGGSNGGTL